MPKRFFIVCFIIIIFLCGTASAQINCIRIGFSIHQDDSETTVSFDEDFSEDGVRIISDLFPSYFVSVAGMDGTEMIRFIQEGITIYGFSLPDMPQILTKLASEMVNTEISGIFTGDAFNEAYSGTEGSCDYSVLLNILKNTADLPENSFSIPAEISGVSLSDLTSLTVRYRIFESGRYLSLTGMIGEYTVFTLSADFSDKNHHKIVWGYPENGHNYYWEVDLSIFSDENMQLTAALFSDINKAGYRSISPNDPVLKENWTFQLSEDRRKLSYEGLIIPEKEKSTISVTGNCTPFDDEILHMEMKFLNGSDAWYSLSVCREQQSFDYSGLKKITVSDLQESSMSGFTGEISIHMLSLYSELIRTLPDEYARFFMNSSDY